MTIRDPHFKEVLRVFNPDNLTSVNTNRIRDIYRGVGFDGSSLEYKTGSMLHKAQYTHRKIKELEKRRMKDARELKRLRDLFRNR